MTRTAVTVLLAWPLTWPLAWLLTSLLTASAQARQTAGVDEAAPPGGAAGSEAAAPPPPADADPEAFTPVSDVIAALNVEHPARPVVRARVVETPPVIDGVLDEAVWAEATPITDFRQVEPDEGAPGTEATEVRVLIDPDTVYLGIRCFDREPSRIIATRMQRDGGFGSDDRIAVVLDTFLDRRNAFFFEMNAAGAIGDALIEDNDSFIGEWDGIWIGKAVIDDAGWSAEMAIPAKTLSFDPTTDRWGFNVSRTIRRKSETVRWASPDQDRSFNSIADAGDLGGIIPLRQGLGLDVEPFLTAGWSRADGEDRGADLDAGFDVFWRPTPSLTAAFTFNTDFAETEVDARVVNLTRFPVFFPEKRDFFLQDAGIFEFGGIGRNPLPFFSRRIGIGPDGEERDILAGGKLTGRVGGLNVGLLDVQMKDDEELGAKNLGVARVSANVLEESTVGMIATHGDPNTPGTNTVGGVDFNYRNSSYGGDKVLDGHAWIQKSDSSQTDGRQAAWGWKLGYPNDRVRWQVGFTQIDETFDAALGFVPRRGIREYFGNWRHRWRPGDGIRLIDSGAGFFWVTNLDGMTESRRFDLDLVTIQNDRDDRIFFDVAWVRERLFDPFEIRPDVVIPVGDYEWSRLRVGGRTSTGRPVSVGGSVTWGGFYSGQRMDWAADVEYRVSRHLLLSAEYTQNDIALDEGAFTVRLARARANVFFTPDLAWTNFIQWDDVSERLGVNSRVRWIVNPGDEVFFVVNQGFTTDGRVATTVSEVTTKVGLTFRF